MQFEYRTKGTCSQRIIFDVEDNILKNVQFIGGCNGNLKGISSLVDGMNIDDVITKIEGIQCGFKSTSCPDQLAQDCSFYHTDLPYRQISMLPAKVLPGA